MGIVSWARRKVQDFAGEGSGTASKDAEAGIRSPKPYAAYFSNGLFQGEDGSMWLYFKMPEDVKAEYTETYSEAADTQSYLTNIFNPWGNPFSTIRRKPVKTPGSNSTFRWSGRSSTRFNSSMTLPQLMPTF